MHDKQTHKLYARTPIISTSRLATGYSKDANKNGVHFKTQ